MPSLGFYLCLPKDRHLSASSHLTPDDIGEASIVLREPGLMTHRVYESVCAAVGAELRIQMAAGSDEVVRVGVGLDAIFDGTLGADPALVARPFGDTRKDRGVYVVEVQEALALPPVTAFTEVLTGIQRSSASSVAPSARSDRHPRPARNGRRGLSGQPVRWQPRTAEGRKARSDTQAWFNRRLRRSSIAA